MRKLTQDQKDMIMNRYAFNRLGTLMVLGVQKYGKDDNNLEEDIDWAREIIEEQGAK